MTAETIHSGGCLCGAIRLEAEGPPDAVVACHCASCRKQTGAPFAVYADYPAARIRFISGEAARFASSQGAQRGFCADCGSTLYFRGDNLPEMIHLHVGLFDDAGAFPPTADVHTDTRLPWVQPCGQ